MTVCKHEVKRGFKALIIWSSIISFLMFIVVILYPEMKTQMGDLDQIFANMGDFSAAFGIDQLNFSSLMGFYGIESSNILGIGGAFYAALLGISALADEEKNHTSEFLLTHPVSRARIASEKFLAIVVQIFLLNVISILIVYLGFLLIEESPEWKEFLIFHGAELLLQLEIASICFGISAFIRRGGLGIGLGFAGVLYFLNIFGNISDDAEFVKYITPFSYTEPSDIIGNGTVETGLMVLGAFYALAAVSLALLYYNKKDIAV